MKAVAGVDTHKDSHAIVVVDSVGAVLRMVVIQATAEGYARAIAAVAEYEEVIWGVEGAGSYGRGLVDALLRGGATVYEVPGYTAMARPELCQLSSRVLGLMK